MTKSTNDGDRGGSEKVGDSVRIYRRNETWYVNYQLNGKQHRESLKTTSKKTAVQKALALDRRLAAGENPMRVKPATIPEAVEAYQDYLVAKRRSPKTRTKYWQVFDLAVQFADELGRQFISDIDLPFVDRFRAMRAKTCAARTVHSDVVILRQLVNFAVTRKMVAVDPLLGLRLKRPKPTPQPCFDDEQVTAILANATPAYYATFLLLAETGLRFGEAQWLTWNDVDVKRKVVHVRGKDGWSPKTGDERAVPLTERLLNFMKEKPRVGRWVLTNEPTKAHPEPDRQVSEERTLLALKRILKKLGIPGKLHTFRHTFISRCLTNGIEEAVVRSWVGHVDPAIMRLYTHITSRISQDRIRKLDKGPETEEKPPLADAG